MDAIIEALQINLLLEDSASIFRERKRDYQKLGHNGREMDETGTDSLMDLQLTDPKSSRAFLCGQDYACKTTL